MFSLGDPHHPQELVDVVAGVSDHPSEDDQHVVHVQQPHDVIRHTLIGRHGFPHLKEPIRERESDFLWISVSSCGASVSPGRCGCCSRCCCPLAWFCWPCLRSDTHNPTSSWCVRVGRCWAAANSTPLWNHPGCCASWWKHTGRMDEQVCVCMCVCV